MTSPHREAGEAERERPGIVYLLLPCAARPDTRLMIDAALLEAAALDSRSRPPMVLEIMETRLKEDSQPQGPGLRQSRKRRRNRSMGGLQTIQALSLHKATGVNRRHTLV